jgi:hypothetical protein
MVATVDVDFESARRPLRTAVTLTLGNRATSTPSPFPVVLPIMSKRECTCHSQGAGESACRRSLRRTTP